MQFQQQTKQPKMEEKAASKMAERKDMLILAQQKLDEINRGNLGLSGRGGRPGSASSRNRQRKSAISSHLLSTLLYVALMAHKLEDMKTMLEEEDGDMYDEWRCLLETLHSPEFHARERIIQNRRVKRTFDRKRQYKQDSIRLKKELSDTTKELLDLQKLSNETNNQMSKSINILQEERAALVSKDEEKQYQLEEVNEKISDLQRDWETKDEKLQSLRSEVEKKDSRLEEYDESVSDLEKQLSFYKQEAAVEKIRADTSQASLDETKVRLEVTESRYDEYREEKESLISKLQHDLNEAQSSSKVLNTKLEGVSKALNVANNNLEDGKQTITETTASFDEMRARSDRLKDLVESGISKLDNKLIRAQSVLEDSNDDLQKILSHNEEVSESLAIVTGPIKDRLDQVHEVVSTLSRADSLEKCSDEIQQGLVGVKQKMDDVSESQQSNLYNEFSQVRHKLDGISGYQQESKEGHDQELSSVQQKLDGISEHQHVIKACQDKELTNVQQKLDVISDHQDQGMTRQDQELSNVQYKLDSISQHQQQCKVPRELVNVQQKLDGLTELQRKDTSERELMSVQLKLDGLAELQRQNNNGRELLSVQHKLDGLTELQRQNNSERELLNVQEKLDGLTELQRQNNNEGELMSLQQKLDGLMELQKQNNSDKELLNVQEKLDGLKELQQSNSYHQELLTVQNKLDELSDQQRQNNSEKELLNVQQKLNKLSDQQESRGFQQEFLTVQQKLDELSNPIHRNSIHQELSAVQQKLGDLSERCQQNNDSQLEAIQESRPSTAISTSPEFEAVDARVLQKIAQVIDGVCEKCALMENTIYESNCEADELIETICSTISTLADECIGIKEDVEAAMGGAKTSRATTQSGAGNTMKPAGPVETPPTSALMDASPAGRSQQEEMPRNWSANSADELVDSFVSEAVARQSM